jgi:hypothetical protein
MRGCYDGINPGGVREPANLSGLRTNQTRSPGDQSRAAITVAELYPSRIVTAARPPTPLPSTTNADRAHGRARRPLPQ